MPVFQLSLEKGPRVNFLAKQTKKAILLYLMDGDEQIAYWFPKSQSTLRKRPEIRVVDGNPTPTGKEIFEVSLTDWIWGKREVAAPMGCD